MKIKNYLYNKKFKHNGIEYDLSHLQPIELIMHIKNKEIKTQVEFSTHTFTVDYNSVFHTPDLIIQDKTNLDTKRHHNRAFNLKRYNLSLQLPNIFNNLTPYTKTYYTGRGNFIVRNKNYYIFFRLYRQGNIAKIYVKSAYLRQTKLSGNIKNINKCLLDKGF